MVIAVHDDGPALRGGRPELEAADHSRPFLPRSGAGIDRLSIDTVPSPIRPASLRGASRSAPVDSATDGTAPSRRDRRRPGAVVRRDPLGPAGVSTLHHARADRRHDRSRVAAHRDGACARPSSSPEIHLGETEVIEQTSRGIAWFLYVDVVGFARSAVRVGVILGDQWPHGLSPWADASSRAAAACRAAHDRRALPSRRNDRRAVERAERVHAQTVPHQQCARATRCRASSRPAGRAMGSCPGGITPAVAKPSDPCVQHQGSLPPSSCLRKDSAPRPPPIDCR